MEKCRVCGLDTPVVFNIDLKATPICESCATRITLQQVQWWARNSPKEHPHDND